ncbi:H+-transporting two-sector ATPase [Chondromyces crocatus]|uniref:ATP synthase subunit b n=1 Tax=Chondromyces crocatus TaxID=52 RepID=A0A0K1EUB6_CHOCO|nr:H+-transporting two-sector ATPase [Chondromyces crocatus]
MPVNLHHLAPFASGAISVDFDLTFLAQLVLFTFFILLLKPLLFDPLLRVFEERERRIDGAKAEAREMDEEAGALLTRYEQELEKIQQEAGQERERLRREAAALEAKVLAEAREETARFLEQGKARIATEVAQMRKELAEAQPALAAEIASRVLGREVRS